MHQTFLLSLSRVFVNRFSSINIAQHKTVSGPDYNSEFQRHIVVLVDDRIRRARINDTNQLYDWYDLDYVSSFVPGMKFMCA